MIRGYETPILEVVKRPRERLQKIRLLSKYFKSCHGEEGFNSLCIAFQKIRARKNE